MHIKYVAIFVYDLCSLVLVFFGTWLEGCSTVLCQVTTQHKLIFCKRWLVIFGDCHLVQSSIHCKAQFIYFLHGSCALVIVMFFCMGLKIKVSWQYLKSTLLGISQVYYYSTLSRGLCACLFSCKSLSLSRDLDEYGPTNDVPVSVQLIWFTFINSVLIHLV